MGNYIFDTEVLERGAARRPRRASRRRTTSARTSSRRWSARYPVFAYDFLDNHVPGEGERRARLLARRRHHRRRTSTPTWTCAACSPLLNLYNRLADPHRDAALPAGEVRLRRRGPPRARHRQHRRQRRDHLRRARARLGRLQQRLRAQLLRGRRVDPDAGRQHRPRRPPAARRSATSTSPSRTAR